MTPELKIALDYDGTYSADPRLWDLFIENAQQLGHIVIIVTMRYPDEDIWHDMPCEIFYTSRQAKKRFMENMGHTFDIWIDDNPRWIHENAGEARWSEDTRMLFQCPTEGCGFPKRDPSHAHCPACSAENET